MTTMTRLTLTEDERRALLMLSYGASGAATAMCGGSLTLAATSNALCALVQGDVEGALLALRCLATEAARDAEETPR